VGRHIKFKQNESYNWMNAGWTRQNLGDDAFGDLDRYMGYLKCYYVAGMVGGVAGYFAYPPGGFAADDVGSDPPHWLAQMMALSRVHALFSHYEDLIRNGDLLSGPDRHRWSKDQPAYEFHTGDPSARVMARKHRRRNEWLICAWAAGGADRKVQIDIDLLGEVSLLARSCGAVYRAVLKDGQRQLTLLDKNGLLPTRR